MGVSKYLEEIRKKETDFLVDLYGCTLGTPCPYLQNYFIQEEKKLLFIGQKLHFLSHESKGLPMNYNDYMQKILTHIKSNEFSIIDGKAGSGKTTFSEEIANLFISQADESDGLSIIMTASPHLVEERLFEYQDFRGQMCLGPLGYLRHLAIKCEKKRFVFILHEFNRIPHFISVFGRAFESALQVHGPNQMHGELYQNEMIQFSVVLPSSAEDLSKQRKAFPENLRIILTGNKVEDGYRASIFDVMRDDALSNNRLLMSKMKFLYLDHKPAPSKKRERDGSFVEIPPTEFVPYNVIEKNFQSLIKANLKSEDSDNVLTAMEEYLKSAMKNQTMKMENVMPAKRISQYFIYLRDKQPEIYHSVMQRFKYKLVGSDYAYPIMIIISESKESEKISDFTAGRNLASCTEFEEFRKTLEEEEKNSSSNQSEEVSGIDWLKYIPCFPTNHPDPLFKIEEHFQAVGPSKVIFTSEEAKAQFPEELKSRHLGVKWYTIGRNDHGLMEFLKHAKDPLVLIGFELIPANPFATNLLLDVLLPWLFHHEKKTIQKSIKIRHYIQYDSGAQKTDTVLCGACRRGWHDFVCRVLVLAEVYKMDINCENLVSCIKNVEIVDFLIEKIRQAKGIPTYLNELNVFEKAETCQEFQPTYLLAEAFKTEKKIERNVDAGSLIQCAIQLIEMASIFVSFDQKHSSMFSEMVTQALSIFDEDIKDRTQFVLKAFTTEKEKCETADKLCMWAERVNKQDMLQIIHQVSDI